MKSMHLGKSMTWSLLVASLLLLSWQGRAAAEQIGCAGMAGKVKAVTAPGLHTTHVNYDTDANGNVTNIGQLDPMPLLATTVTVGGTQPSCLVTHFSTMLRPTDNHTFLQVRVDGVPMEGHLDGYYGMIGPSIVEPEAYESADTLPNVDVWRTVSHSFFTRVAPGTHRVGVLWAACCSAPGLALAEAGSPVLVLQYK